MRYFGLVDLNKSFYATKLGFGGFKFGAFLYSAKLVVQEGFQGFAFHGTSKAGEAEAPSFPYAAVISPYMRPAGRSTPKPRRSSARIVTRFLVKSSFTKPISTTAP